MAIKSLGPELTDYLKNKGKLFFGIMIKIASIVANTESHKKASSLNNLFF